MKTIKTIGVVSVLVFSMTTLAFAAWWNPFSWGWFKKNTPVVQVVQNQVATSTVVSNVDETNGWKIYTDTKNGFEVKYPSNFYVTWQGTWGKEGSIDAQSVVDFSEYKIAPERQYAGVRFIVSNFSGELNKYVKDKAKQFDLENSNLKTAITEIKIDDVVAYKIKNELYFVKNGKMFFVNNGVDGKIFDQMISTFKFVNVASTTAVLSNVAQLPTSCKGISDGVPVITSLSKTSGSIGTMLEVKGCNLSGYEGDLNLTLERADGKKINLKDNFGSFRKTADKLIKVAIKEPCKKGEMVANDYSGISLQCDYVEITPGTYKVYTSPWNKLSNMAYFTVTSK